jgi:hypothetical protein
METLRLGDTGPEVLFLKQALQERAYFHGDVHNDHFDHDTEHAVRELQRYHHLHDDGVVGEQTWEAMGLQDDASVMHQTQNSDQVTFGEGTTLTPGDTHLAGLVEPTANARLDHFQHELERAADDFWAHAHEQTESLHGDADFPFGHLFTMLGHGLTLVFPELEAMEMIKKVIDGVLTAAAEAAPHMDHITADSARDKARHAAYELRTTIVNGAAAGRHHAGQAMTAHLQSTFALHPELRDGVTGGDEHTKGLVCDWAGIYDTIQHSPYTAVRAQLEEDFAQVLVQLRAAVSTHFATPTVQRFQQARDEQHARDAADLELAEELRAHPRN